MSLPRRFVAPVAPVLVAVLTVACGTQATPTATPPTAAPSADAAVARDAYSAAICPVFTSILELDPRLAAMRRAGTQGGDMSSHATEIAAVSDELLVLLEDLEAVPEWSSGADLRYHLITALHGIRARLLRVSDDLPASGTADDLANLPFIASDAMDLAMQDAVEGGLACGDAP
jgi:hypothetical protein